MSVADRASRSFHGRASCSQVARSLRKEISMNSADVIVLTAVRFLHRVT
jgi:hypothetical protein